LTIPLDSIPGFTADEAAAAAEREYGIRGATTSLPSERDQNFLIASPGGVKHVLKIANSGDLPELLDFQNQAMRRVSLAGAGCRVQEVMRSLRRREIERVRNERTGGEHCLRLMSWIDGHVLAEVSARDAALLDSVGAGLARVDRALGDFAHPAMHRVLQWDIRHASMAREHLHLLPAVQRAQIERHFGRWRTVDWRLLRHGVIHGDANDHNLLVEGGRMAGLLDFGDMAFTAVACELAIALAYVMLGQPRPLEPAGHVARAYQRAYPLSDVERRALPTLVLSRLAMSVCYSAHNRARNPGDPYQVVSETAAWELLDRLEPHAADGTLTF
jgi:Ser/Thr protein kinase RdoA (MazF antagonist)